MIVTLRDGTRLDVEDRAIGQGGMGTGYLTKDGQKFVKLFHQPTPALEHALSLILTRYNCTLDPYHRERESWWQTLYLWPQAMITAPRLGLITDRLPLNVKNLLYLFGPRSYARMPADSKRWNARVMMAWRLTQAVARMHQLGVAHADLSPNNVLGDPLTGQVRIIDIDSLVVPGALRPLVAGTPGYMAPEILGQHTAPDITTDRHALAVLLYQLLLYAHPLRGPHTYDLDPFEATAIEQQQLGEQGIYIAHPTDKRNRPSVGYFEPGMLGPRLHELFLRTFVEGLRRPERRPLAVEWKLALGHLFDRLVVCQNPVCDERYFPVREHEPPICPWCETPLVLPHGLPVLRLYEPGREGLVILPDFWVVAWPGRTLHGWHAQRGAEPDVFADQAPVGLLEAEGEDFLLINEGLQGLALLDAQGRVQENIPVGREILLKEGQILRLGNPPETRFALVQWMR